MRERRTSVALLPVLLAVLLGVGVLAACSGSGPTPPAAQRTLTVGTTDAATTLDPAGAPDPIGRMLIVNVFQTLLSIPAGGGPPQPDAAEQCKFAAPTVYTCRLRDKAQFSDLTPITPEDVKFTFDRIRTIHAPGGPAPMFAGRLLRVRVLDEHSVAFDLSFTDATWPYRLATTAASILPRARYDAHRLQGDDPAEVIGSGLYTLASYQRGGRIELAANAAYTGQSRILNDRVVITHQADAGALADAVRSSRVEVAYRSLDPATVADLGRAGATPSPGAGSSTATPTPTPTPEGQASLLPGPDGLQIVRGPGVGVNVLAFATRTRPFDRPAVRQAAALLVDRARLVATVPPGTIDPLWSTVPGGVDGHLDAFRTASGPGPDAARARKLLDRAGLSTPVPLTLGYDPGREATGARAQVTELARQLVVGGLFRVTLRAGQSSTLSGAAAAGRLDAWVVGRFPDFADPDGYLSPFYGSATLLGPGYDGRFAGADADLRREQSTTDSADRRPALERLQTDGATQVPVIPLWSDRMTVVAGGGVDGVASTVDTLSTLRFWWMRPPG